MINRRILRQLESVDWDFPSELPGSSRALHWYPGTFPAQLPATLVQALSKPGDIVFDPFGGIGTTVGEAVRLGRKAWVVDSNPIAVLTSYVKCGLLLLRASKPALPGRLFSDMSAFVHVSLRDPTSRLDLGLDNLQGESIDTLLASIMRPHPEEFFNALAASLPNIKDLSFWMEQETLREVTTLRQRLVSSDLGYFGKLLGLTMLSAILRPASSQTRSWGHIADNVLPKDYMRKDVLRLCANWQARTRNIIERVDVQQIGSSERKSIRGWISLHDWANDQRPRPAPLLCPKLLITSPPYGGAIDYTLAQRLSLYFLGYDDDKIHGLCYREIGARRKRFTSDARQGWADDLIAALDKQLKQLNETSIVVLVLPHKDVSREIGTKMVSDCMTEAGWNLIYRVERSIRQARTRQSWTSIKKESVRIYTREFNL